MLYRTSSALRGAVVLSSFLVGCGDSLLGPRPTGETGAVHPPPPIAGIRTYSGRAADSVLKLLDESFARLGRADYTAKRHAWRKENGVPENVGEPLASPPRAFAPNADLASTDGSIEKPAPKIVSHYEALHFGWKDAQVNISTGVEGEMTFIGDQGEIQLGSLTITTTNGASPFYASGGITRGSGDLISCGDLIFGGCEGQRYLAGLMMLDGAPFCSASGNGTVNYYAYNVSLQPGTSTSFTPLSTSTGGAQGGAAANGQVKATANACPQPTPTEPTGTPYSGDTPDGTGGGTSGSPTEPWQPEPTPSNPAPTAPTGGTLYCSSETVYQVIDGVEVFLGFAAVCYPY